MNKTRASVHLLQVNKCLTLIHAENKGLCVSWTLKQEKKSVYLDMML